jgi:Lysine-specific metallo-endopeptidase
MEANMGSFEPIARWAIVFTLWFASPSLFAAPIECDRSQMGEIRLAKENANQLLNAAIIGINTSDPLAASKLTTWVGAVNSQQAKDFANRLSLILANLNKTHFQCENNTPVEMNRATYGYVDPQQQFVVTIGPLFWKARYPGFSSRSGVLVHEVSHFLLSGKAMDPLDKVYGIKAALENAIKNPSDAQKNAENIEYFVESLGYNLTP